MCYTGSPCYGVPRAGMGRVRHEANRGQNQKSLRPARPVLRIILISHFGPLGVLKSPRVTWPREPLIYSAVPAVQGGTAKINGDNPLIL